MTKYLPLEGTQRDSQDEFLPVPLKVGKVIKLKMPQIKNIFLPRGYREGVTVKNVYSFCLQIPNRQARRTNITISAQS